MGPSVDVSQPTGSMTVSDESPPQEVSSMKKSLPGTKAEIPMGDGHHLAKGNLGQRPPGAVLSWLVSVR